MMPYCADYNLDVYCSSPIGRSYHFFHYHDRIESNISNVYAEYGAAETGLHQITFVWEVSQNMNVHINIREWDSLETFNKLIEWAKEGRERRRVVWCWTFVEGAYTNYDFSYTSPFCKKYQEITIDQFEKYVLNKYIEKDFTYLIKFLNKQNEDNI